MPGPSRTPTKILKLRGSREAKSRKSEPQPATGAPLCPSWMTARAKVEWRRIAPELTRLGLLTGVDKSALAAYCTAVAEMEDAVKVLEAEGRYQKSTTGSIQRHPAHLTLAESLKRVASLSHLFGLSPGSRSKVTATEAVEEDDLGAFADRKRRA